jgi:hypothetical protein
MTSTDFFRFYNVKENANVAFQPSTEHIHRLSWEFARNEPPNSQLLSNIFITPVQVEYESTQLRRNLKMNS